MSDSLVPEIVCGPGEGVSINLSGNEIARAIWEWLEFRYGMRIRGPRTVTVDGELLRDREGRVYVDPSGRIEEESPQRLASDCDCECCREGRCVCRDFPCPCDQQLYAVVALTRHKEGEAGVPSAVKLARGMAAAQKELRRMADVARIPGQKYKVEVGESGLWAHVHLGCGVSYGFYAEKTSWAKEGA